MPQDNSLQQFIRTQQIERGIERRTEEAVRQGLILPLLHRLGWDPFNTDEVHPEYSIGTTRVDYSLRILQANKVFIEVKRLSENLENHQQQLLLYAFQEGVRLAVLTNGIVWWFYLPLQSGDWQQRRFYSIDIYQQDVSTISENLSKFLAREKLANNQAYIDAEAIHHSHQRTDTIRRAIPSVWNRLVLSRDHRLLEVLAEAVETVTGYRPEADSVFDFLSHHISTQGSRNPTPVLPPLTESPQEDTYTLPEETQAIRSSRVYSSIRYKPERVVFRGSETRVNTWVDAYGWLINELFKHHESEFDRVLSMHGNQKPFFSTDPTSLRRPQLIPHSVIYAEANLSASTIKQRIAALLEVFNYTLLDLVIEERATNAPQVVSNEELPLS